MRRKTTTTTTDHRRVLVLVVVEGFGAMRVAIVHVLRLRFAGIMRRVGGDDTRSGVRVGVGAGGKLLGEDTVCTECLDQLRVNLG